MPLLDFLQESFARSPLSTALGIVASVMTIATSLNLLWRIMQETKVESYHWWGVLILFAYTLFGGYQIRREHRYWLRDVDCRMSRRSIEHVKGGKRYWFYCSQDGERRSLQVTKAEYYRCYPGYRLKKGWRTFRIRCTRR